MSCSSIRAIARRHKRSIQNLIYRRKFIAAMDLNMENILAGLGRSLSHQARFGRRVQCDVRLFSVTAAETSGLQVLPDPMEIAHNYVRDAEHRNPGLVVKKVWVNGQVAYVRPA